MYTKENPMYVFRVSYYRKSKGPIIVGVGGALNVLAPSVDEAKKKTLRFIRGRKLHAGSRITGVKFLAGVSI